MSLFGPTLAGSAGQGSSADLGKPIDQSLRFENSGFLTRTISTGGNRQQFTFSTWIKRAALTTDQVILATGDPTGSQPFFNLQFLGGTAYTVRIVQYDGATVSVDLRPSRLFRDPSAWYHFVLAVDTTQSTSSDRVKFYVNGDLITSYGTSTYPGPSLNTYVNQSGNTQRIGTYIHAASQDLDGYLAETHFLDGTVLDADDFGRTNDDGVWVPSSTSFTAAQYGINGFHLTYDSSQTNSGIGEDSAPIGASGHTARNDFTASGFDTASISSSNPDNDVDYNDTPTSNYATFNPLHARFSALNHANLGIGTSSSWNHSSGTVVPETGKYYWEYVATSASNGRVGFMNIDRNQYDGSMGTQTGYWWVGGGGEVYSNGSAQTSITSWSNGDVIGIRFDRDNDEVKAYRNNSLIHTWDISSVTERLAPMVSGANTPNNTINFGQMPFIYTIPTGYSALQTNNLPEPTIKNGKEHFEAVTYPGTNNSNSITSLEFSPALIWIKVIDGVDNHVLVDSIRGADAVLFPNSTDDEASSFSRFTSFDSNGFTVDTSDTSWNNSSNNYVAWCWSAPDTWASTDADVTAGTIASSGRRNKDAGFSIVSYTGDNDGPGTFDTIAHGLQDSNGAVTPDLIIVKGRNFVDEWHVKHVDMNNADSIRFNISTVGANFNAWNNTAPNSNVFTVGPIDGTNKNGAPFIAYCWKSIKGYSKFGSYTATGSTDGPFVYLGFRPQLVITKTISGVNDSWTIWDSTRGPTNPNKFTLVADSTARDVLTGNDIDFLSNGFKLRNTIGNQSGGQYVYLAWAENPFGGENQPPATAR